MKKIEQKHIRYIEYMVEDMNFNFHMKNLPIWAFGFSLLLPKVAQNSIFIQIFNPDAINDPDHRNAFKAMLQLHWIKFAYKKIWKKQLYWRINDCKQDLSNYTLGNLGQKIKTLVP